MTSLLIALKFRVQLDYKCELYLNVKNAFFKLATLVPFLTVLKLHRMVYGCIGQKAEERINRAVSVVTIKKLFYLSFSLKHSLSLFLFSIFTFASIYLFI